MTAESLSDYRSRRILEAACKAIEDGGNTRDEIWRALLAQREYDGLIATAMWEKGELPRAHITPRELEQQIWATASRYLAPLPMQPKGKHKTSDWWIGQ